MSDGSDAPRLTSVRGEVVVTLAVPVAGALDPARTVEDVRLRVAEAAVQAVFGELRELEPRMLGLAVVTRLVIGAQDQVQG